MECGSTDRFLSILPVYGISLRSIYMSQFILVPSYFTNVRDMRDDFGKAKPTFYGFCSRLWESIYLGIYNRLNESKTNSSQERKYLIQLTSFLKITMQQ